MVADSAAVIVSRVVLRRWPLPHHLVVVVAAAAATAVVFRNNIGIVNPNLVNFSKSRPVERVVSCYGWGRHSSWPGHPNDAVPLEWWLPHVGLNWPRLGMM